MLTGKLGDVMQESAQAAFDLHKSFVPNVWAWSIDIIRKRDLHIHVPEGRNSQGWPIGGNYHGTAMASALTVLRFARMWR